MFKLRNNIFALRLAMSFQKAALSNLGGVQKYKDEFRAHIQFRDEEGKKTNIRGPLRATEREAYDDLEDIRLIPARRLHLIGFRSYSGLSGGHLDPNHALPLCHSSLLN